MWCDLLLVFISCFYIYICIPYLLFTYKYIVYTIHLPIGIIVAWFRSFVCTRNHPSFFISSIHQLASFISFLRILIPHYACCQYSCNLHQQFKIQQQTQKENCQTINTTLLIVRVSSFHGVASLTFDKPQTENYAVK